MNRQTQSPSVWHFQKQVKVTRQHNEECKNLLKLMGIPYVEVRLSEDITSMQSLSHRAQAPCEAEAQCAALVKAGIVNTSIKVYILLAILFL